MQDRTEATRPPFILYRPVEDSQTMLAFERELPWRIAGRGHECIVYSDRPVRAAPLVKHWPADHVDYAAAGLWLMIGDHPSVRDRLQAAGRRGVYELGGDTDDNQEPAEWDRIVSLWTAISYDHFPGIVWSRHRDHWYKHINHFTFGHLGEQESRRDWLDVGPGQLMLDIGASLGSWTLPAAASGAKVCAFEPGSDADQLDDHIAMNNLTNRVNVVRKLVSNRDGDSIAPKDLPWHSVPPRRAVSATSTISIDTFVATNNIKHVDFIKIDVDGAELSVLHGARNTIGECRPRLVIEVHTFLNVSVADVLKLLQPYNYTCSIAPKEQGYYHHVYAR